MQVGAIAIRLEAVTIFLRHVAPFIGMFSTVTFGHGFNCFAAATGSVLFFFRPAFIYVSCAGFSFILVLKLSFFLRPNF